MRFAGQYQDAESTLYYLRARYYDTARAQFISVDPVVPITRQPYSYVAEDPLNLADPSGFLGWNDVTNVAKTVLHVVLDIAAVPPYATYYGAYHAMKGIDNWGNKHGLLGTVATRAITAPILIPEAAGLGGDVAIDWIKGHTVNN